MRYFAGFVGGLVAGILLFVFQNYLISGERHVDQPPPIEIFQAQPRISKPPETKDYRPPKELPEPPKTPEQPVSSMEPLTSPALPQLQRAQWNGAGVHLPGDRVTDWRAPRSGDGPAVAMVTVAPRYPANALRNHLEGEVEVEFTILPDGSVADVRVIRATPPGVFDQEARRAVLRWQFRPQMQDGRATSMRARQVIEFRLPGE